MLKKLYIRNFTLIDELNIPFFPGFSVITGETGAGKSIILGAIGLLLGNRADAKQVKTGASKCVVEAVFDVGHDKNGAIKQFFDTNDLDFVPDECILRRELSAAGKSRAFVNDTPVTLILLRELGEHLIDIHSQHQNLLLGKENFQLSVIDILAKDGEQLARYRAAYKQYEDEVRLLTKMRKDIETSTAEADFLRFQHKELNEANLVEGEQEELEQKSETMSHAEEIKTSLYLADSCLNGEEGGVINNLKSVLSHLSDIAPVFAKANELSERLDNCYIEVKDIADDISASVDDIEFDPRQLQNINDRLDVLYSLEHKYHVDSVEALIQHLNTVAERIENIDTGEEKIEEQEQLVEQRRADCEKLAAELSAKRHEAALAVEKGMAERLVPLGIPKVRFKVEMTPIAIGPDGADKIVFLFSANSSSPMQQVSQVASGGEIARVMLSLKAMMGNAVDLPTIIFDEIDTGVSGRVAEQMAHIMKEMGHTDRQVISITHLPQIAAVGATHYKVEKEETEAGTTSKMRLLKADERVTEIAQMLSGSEVTQAAIDNAQALLKN